MLFGRRRESAPAVQQTTRGRGVIEPERYVVAYENMLKGNKLSRRGKPIRQVAIVVDGTVRLITSGDAVDRATYEALIGAGVLPPPGRRMQDDGLPPESLPDPEARA